MKKSGFCWRISMNFEDALKQIREFGGTMYRKSNFIHCYKLNLETNTIYKVDVFNLENEIKEPAIFSSMDIMNDDWQVNLSVCWVDQ